MGKKIPLLISTLTLLGGLGLAASAPTYATEEDTYWSIPEALEALPELEAAKTELCGLNWGCREGLNQAYRSLGGKIGAAAGMIDRKFIVTSINPSNDTVKVIYFDEDLDESTWNVEHYNLTELELFWTDVDSVNPAYNGSYYFIYGEALASGDTSSGAHSIISEDEARNGAGWFTPKQEILYHVSDLSLMPKSEMHFFLTTEHGSMLSTVDFSECTNSDEYHFGMECRVMLDDRDQWPRYVPYDPASAADVGDDAADDGAAASGSDTSGEGTIDPLNLTDGTASSEDEDTGGKGNATGDANTQSYTANSNTSGSTASVSNQSENSTAKSSASSPSTPNTGQVTAEMPNASSEFPWWLGTIITLSCAVTLWIFWPFGSKTHKKHKK